VSWPTTACSTHAATVGRVHPRRSLARRLAGVAGVREIRGQGLMIGIELDRPCGDLVRQALAEQKFLINVTSDTVVRLLPPLVMKHEPRPTNCCRETGGADPRISWSEVDMVAPQVISCNSRTSRATNSPICSSARVSSRSVSSATSLTIRSATAPWR
jgi:hypothetical protein